MQVVAVTCSACGFLSNEKPGVATCAFCGSADVAEVPTEAPLSHDREFLELCSAKFGKSYASLKQISDEFAFDETFIHLTIKNAELWQYCLEQPTFEALLDLCGANQHKRGPAICPGPQ
ncbi:hypothetical protein SS50377_24804 [Spironucleus salmonicida]|nr:hypothetical protein SS50377_24784 [Spironucleus salmonicida]KAH0572689.1 hypothetical protein SS50377_24801 [Spironucleus salmonicida]KAH0572692.1 hypothetical protein SS50377_24804 [Spironucleus salmonicida]|eukprot:EST44122.1 Hypothetical protein SS50377_16080 [Spironucleus salmonicida]